MQLNYLALAVPFFCSLMLLEYYLSVKKEKRENFQFHEVVANLNVGIAERLSDLFTTGLFYFFFAWLYREFAIFDIKPTAITWVLLFLFTDLLWYWYHRFGHEVNIFWGVHVVHHQSDDFNFTVAARITVLQAAARSMFWAFLPILGFPPEMITLLLMIHGTYPFFTHTQLVGKLGWLEYFLVTPSHHRVHHSSNPEYLDKNYGDVLIIWDKLFGTFKEEKTKAVYGLTSPLNSSSFLWQHFHFLMEMGVAFKRARTIKEKWRVLFGKPDDIDPRIRPMLERKLSQRRPQTGNNQSLRNYIVVQTILSLLLLFFAILFEHYLNTSQLTCIGLFIILSLITTGAMLEQKQWIFLLEIGRLSVLGMLLWQYYPNAYTAFTVTLILLVLVLFFRSIGRQYNRYLYG